VSLFEDDIGAFAASCLAALLSRSAALMQIRIGVFEWAICTVVRDYEVLIR
jgi:hypothetical protein